MENVNTFHNPCWRCQSVNTYEGSLCEICGANLNTPDAPDAPPQHKPTADYPRANHYQTAPTLGVGTIQVPAGTHSVTLVVVLSILFGGWAGMLVNRQYAKAILYGLVAGFGLALITCGFSALIWYPLTLIDAIMVAMKLNQGRAIKEWEFF